MSLTPIYDDLLREFEGILLVSEAAEAVATGTAEGGDAPRADGPTPDVEPDQG
ncbi:hypothetical protein ACFXGA_08040 [Actinosynnema sp. NPDC059335]|uniref:hypothetical protein n=1 Tax=Actinosynnema sp. NPDC059335 TaxID=3346804 RepID=UPI0036732EE5